MTESSAEMPCVGGLAYDADGRLLLVRRRNEAGRGLWPVDSGTVVREMAEEIGLVHAVTSS